MKSKLLILTTCVLLSACNGRFKPKQPSAERAAGEPVAVEQVVQLPRIAVVRIGVVEDNLIKSDQRGIYQITDRVTGRTWITVGELKFVTEITGTTK